MKKNKFSIPRIPGWIAMLAIFGVLYLTGLHTEVIGQVQRALLFTGVMKVDVPEPLVNNNADTSEISTGAEVEMVGNGFQMKSLSGKTVSLESMKGKVIFMNIWATWCPPCIAEMPNIQSLYDKVGSDKIAFVMLSVDKGGSSKVKKFIDKKGFTFPVYFPASAIPSEFNSQAIPTTFIISPEGNIVSRHEGMAAYDTKEFREFLLSLAQQK